MSIPPQHRQVSVNPSVVGLAGGGGDIVVDPDGQAWAFKGPSVTDWVEFPGDAGGLATVVTDDTLDGDGSEDSPLGIPDPWTVVGPTVGDAADLTIASGIDGDNDGDYEIIVELAACAGTENFTLRPNNSDTGCDSMSMFCNNNGSGGGSVATINSATLFCTDAINAQAPRMHIRLQSDSARNRQFICNAQRGGRGTSGGSSGAIFFTMGQLTAAAGNITSLVLHGDSADAVKAGAVVKWRRLRVP